MTPSTLTEPSAFTRDDHRELDCTFFKTGDDSILSGSVTVTGADGKAETFTVGDSFFIAKGTKCTWHITETLRKFYMTASGIVISPWLTSTDRPATRIAVTAPSVRSASTSRRLGRPISTPWSTDQRSVPFVSPARGAR